MGRKIGASLFRSFVALAVGFSFLGHSACLAADVTTKTADTAEAQAAQKPQLELHAGHLAGIKSIAFSPDGKTIATAGYDNTIKLWDAESGKELRTLTGCTHQISRVVFSPESNTVISGSGDNLIRVWDVASGKQLRATATPSMILNYFALSPDGKLVCAAEGGKTIIWDFASGAVVRTIDTYPQHLPTFLTFTADNTAIVSGYNEIKKFDVATGKELLTFPDKADSVSTLTASPDGKYIAVGTMSDPNAKLFDVATGKLVHSMRVPGEPNKDKFIMDNFETVLQSAFTPDSKKLAAVGGDSNIRLFDVATGKQLLDLKGFESFLGSKFDIAFNGNGTRLAAAGNEGVIKVWDSSSGKNLLTLTPHLSRLGSAIVSHDGKTIASTHGPVIKLWDVVSGNIRNVIVAADDEAPNTLAFSPDDKLLVAGTAGGAVIFFDATSGKQTLDFIANSVTGIAFSPDGKSIATSGGDRKIKIWDLAGKKVREHAGFEDRCTAVAFSPDGKILAGATEQSITLWDAAAGTELQKISGRFRWVSALAFNPDGTILASANADNSVRLWDVGSGKELRALEGHAGTVNSVIFSDDGKMIASGSQDKTLKLWDAASGKELRTLSGHSDNVSSVSFLADGKRLVSTSEDNTMKFWDPNIDSELVSVCALDTTDWVAMTPDGRFDYSPNGMKYLGLRVGNDLVPVKEESRQEQIVAKLLGAAKESSATPSH